MKVFGGEGALGADGQPDEAAASRPAHVILSNGHKFAIPEVKGKELKMQSLLLVCIYLQMLLCR